jgi:hypothetical protein
MTPQFAVGVSSAACKLQSYCDKLAKAGSYLSRGGESTACKQQEPISFNEYGDLEYCS